MIKKKEVEDNILAINSDILFETNLTKFLEHHIELTNDITVGTAKYSYKLPYGVVNENVEAATLVSPGAQIACTAQLYSVFSTNPVAV